MHWVFKKRLISLEMWSFLYIYIYIYIYIGNTLYISSDINLFLNTQDIYIYIYLIYLALEGVVSDVLLGFFESFGFSNIMLHSPSRPYQRWSVFDTQSSSLAMLCVLWWGALDRLWLRAAQSVRVCSTTGYITSGLRGPSPQALTLFGGVGFIARRLRRPEKGNADGVLGIFGTACRVGLRPCDRTHLKNGLVPYSYAGGA